MESLVFNPRLLSKEEFLRKPKTFKYIDIDKQVKQIQLEEDSLAFTYCQIPIIYKLSDKEGLEIESKQGEALQFENFKPQ